MATATRKQRDMEQREALILKVAQEMLVVDGYLGMTMDRIATQCEYSKGTIYNHFPNKEEVVAALAVQTMNLRADLFNRASTFGGKSRERMAAVGYSLELFVRLYPHQFKALSIIQAASVRQKTSDERQQALQACDNRCMAIVTGIVRDGIAQGDLVLPAGTTSEHLTFGLWTMNYGAYTVMGTDIPLAELGIDDPFQVTHRNSQLLLDGYDWRPLSSEWDYEATITRISKEIFSDEMLQLEGH
jgi:AcrR family transcriptional regulator